MKYYVVAAMSSSSEGRIWFCGDSFGSNRGFPIEVAWDEETGRFLDESCWDNVLFYDKAPPISDPYFLLEVEV